MAEHNRYSLRAMFLGVACVAAGCLLYTLLKKSQREYSKSEYFEAAQRSVSYVVNSIEFLDTQPYVGNKARHRSYFYENDDKISWRLKYVALTPWKSADNLPPGHNVPWQSQFWNEWDDECHGTFCLCKDRSHLPRSERYTSLMTIVGRGSAYEFMKENGFEELSRVAPNTILVVEVSNSKTPWLQVGDLELDNIPASVNSPGELGIGSARGYSQFVVGFADKSVWMINSFIPFRELERFLTVEHSVGLDRQATLGQYGYEVDTDSL